MLFSFEKLYIYQRSVDFLERMDKVLHDLFSDSAGPLVSEIRNSSMAIPTWIANGNSLRDKEERKDSYRRSRSAAFACIPCLEILTRREAIPKPVSEAIRDELFCITKMISALIYSQDRQSENPPTVRGELNASCGEDSRECPEASEAAGPT